LNCLQSNRNLPEYKWSKNGVKMLGSSVERGLYVASSKKSSDRFICSHVAYIIHVVSIVLKKIESEFIQRQGSIYNNIFTHCTWEIAIINIPNWNLK
jgi:hypothetical protein